MRLTRCLVVIVGLTFCPVFPVTALLCGTEPWKVKVCQDNHVKCLSKDFNVEAGELIPIGTPQSRPRAPAAPSASPTRQPSKLASRAVDPNGPKYKLIFSPTGGVEAFIAQLNRAGEQGYRFSSAVFDWTVDPEDEYRGPATLLKLDEGKYEFSFFEIRTAGFFHKPGFEEKYEEFAKRGFHVVDHFHVAGGCDYIDPENYASGMRCDITYLFLLERVVGGRPVEFLVAGDTSKWRGIPSASIATEMNLMLAQGFAPVNIVSRMQVLLEKTELNDEPQSEKPHLELVSASTRRLNDLGKRGYRLAFLFDERALMYRDRETDPRRSYVMITAKSSDVQKKLLALQRQGAVYRTMYRDGHLSGDKLVFEEPVRSEQRPQREYRALRVEFVGDHTGRVQLSPAGREAMKTFESLATEGFTVRALYRTGRGFTIGIFLER